MVIRITSTVGIGEEELAFRFTRSGGPGGQNVNKVSSRVELLFDVKNSPSLTDEEKARVMHALRSRLDADGVLRLASQESRSQWKNRQRVVEKFAALMRTALSRPKARKATASTKVSKAARLEWKKRRGAKKKLRGRVQASE